MRSRTEKKANLTVDHIDAGILAEIEQNAANTEHGSIMLIVQDARLIQMDIIKKVRFAETPAASPAGYSRDRTGHGGDRNNFAEQIAAALRGMKFGQVVLVIKEGRVVQVERTEKQRFPWLEGIYGEGI